MGPCAAWFYEGQLRLHRNNNNNNHLTQRLQLGRKPDITLLVLVIFCPLAFNVRERPEGRRRFCTVGGGPSEKPQQKLLTSFPFSYIYRLLTPPAHISLHVLHCLLPDKRSHRYQLRSRPHDCILTAKDDTRNFLHRFMHCDIY